MKVGCESCGTKYTIADEKVRGRAFRVKCKKCGTTFIVRGDEPESSAAGAAPPQTAPATGAVWYVLVAGVQRGPLAVAEVEDLLRTGEATEDHYAWRDGLDGWKPVKEIGELAGLLPSSSLPPAVTPPPSRSEADEEPIALSTPLAAAKPEEEEDEETRLHTTGGIFAPQSPAAGIFAAPMSATAPLDDDEPVPLAASTGGRAAGGRDLFAGLGAAPETVEPALPDPAPTSSAMTGARNENSVLFSLSSLQALASGPAKKEAETAAPESTFGALEGLRPLAPSAGERDLLDDIIHLGGASPFQPTVGAPILAPAAPSESRGLLYALFTVAFLLLAGIIVLVVLLLRRPEPVARANDRRTEDRDRARDGARDPATSAPATSAPATSAPASASPETATAGDRNRDRDRDRDREPEGEPGRTTAPDRDRDRQPEKQPEKQPDDPLARDLDRALKNQPPQEPPRTAAPSTAAPAGDSTPDRATVVGAMSSVTGAVRACAEGQTGTANIRITFAGGSGRVTTAQVVGPPFAGTPAGSCMARAARSATVPPFSNPSLTVTFPFVIR